MSWYKVFYIEIARDGIDQEEGFDMIDAESPTAAETQVEQGCKEIGAKCYGYKATLATDSEIRMHLADIQRKHTDDMHDASNWRADHPGTSGLL